MTKIPTIAVFGASGLTGRALLARIAARGWPARVLVRREGAGLVPSKHLAVRVGNLLTPEDVSDVVTGSDTVCCVFGPRLGTPDVFCAEAMRIIVEAMKRHGVRRLICLTGAMIGDYPQNRSPALRWMARAFAKRQPALAADRAEQERIARDSGLDWTLVKPARLTDGPRTGRVFVGPELRVGLLSKVSRSDLAEAILEEAGRPGFVGRAVFVAS